MIQAKLICMSTHGSQRHYGGEMVVGGEVKLSPVYEGDDGLHKDWANATPSGDVSLHIDNPTAFAQFVPGKLYLMSLEKCDE